MDTKANIRHCILRKRDALTAAEREEKSRRITERLLGTGQYQRAGVILTYINFKSEVGTEELIQAAWKDGKGVFCPRVQGDEMEFYQIFSMEDLCRGYMGIREPRTAGRQCFGEKELAGAAPLMLMPGAVFDRERNRIGYGKGYYDRYLEKYPGLPAIGICFCCQLTDWVPAGWYDKKPNMVITEECIIPPPDC
ncbi:MAG: 5-formyltetrahydrofolate cyclo-ligase [Lachnospiraceae bacterium]|nr:5-formyltetrahydrofolate cyclo-ligase [Lachnospiraceae bacterium]